MNIQELTSKSEEAAGLLAMLANPFRLRIMCELHKGERSVSALEAVIGLSQSALSQHLAKLRGAGLVKTRREAQTIHYSVQDERAARLLAVLYELYCTNPTAPGFKGRKTK
jgi:DNA-binding transcriptional ArsR family regulator